MAKKKKVVEEKITEEMDSQDFIEPKTEVIKEEKKKKTAQDPNRVQGKQRKFL